MSVFGQFIQLGPYLPNNILQTIKVTHYAAGTTTLKDVYLDRTKVITAAQPVVSDANGIVSFYADGLYKFIIEGSPDGVTYTTLYTYDNVACTDQTQTLTGVGDDIASASTLVLGVNGGDIFTVLGTTTVTALSGLQSEVTLIFDGSLTLTNSSSLILQDGANYTTTAGDVMKFIQESSGIWREVNRTKNPYGKSVPTTVGTLGQSLCMTSLTAQSFGALPGQLWGCTLSNNAGDATNDIDIAAGEVASDDAAFTNRTMMTVTAITKQLDATWAVGTNAGGRASGAAIANTTYHVFVIQRPDTGVVDVAFDTSATGANLAANTNAAYTKKRRIGSIIRSGGTILGFVQDGDYFRLKATVLSVDTTNPGTSAVSATLTVPTGLNVVANVNAFFASTTDATIDHLIFSDLAANDESPSNSAAPLTQLSSNNAFIGFGQFFIRTNTSSQIRYRANVSDGNTIIRIATAGWSDTRGRMG